MTYDELLALTKEKDRSFSHPDSVFSWNDKVNHALYAVVELHHPRDFEIAPDIYKLVCVCQIGAIEMYPCSTIQTIMNELQ